MEVFLALDIPPFVLYCVNGKPRSSLFIEPTDSMMNMVQSSHAEQYSSGEVVVLFPGRMVRVVLLMSVENVSPIAIEKNSILAIPYIFISLDIMIPSP